MTSWVELMDQAVIGTRGAPPPGGEWAQHTPEHALLKQFVLAAAARRAGFMAQTTRSIPVADPAPAETLSPCSFLAIQWLENLYRNPYTRELIRDWCLLMIERQRRVPHRALPFVLNIAAANMEWMPYLRPLIGNRGHWLIERTEAYVSLTQQPLEDGGGTMVVDLLPAQIAKNKTLIDLRNQMLEELNDE